MTLWDFLSLPATCTADELKSAWRKKCKEIHPDVNGGDAAKTALFVQAKDIYERALARKLAPPSVYSATSNASTGGVFFYNFMSPEYLDFFIKNLNSIESF